MDLDKNNLFPEVNPNIDEIIEKEDMIDGEEVIKDEDFDYSAPKSTHKDIFMNENIKMDIEEKNEIQKPQLKRTETKIKKDRYAHLARARQKGIETRKRKAEEKRKIKEAQKLKKEEERQARKKATMERNRENARKRYYKQKENKKNIAEKIVKDTKPTPIQETTRNPNNNNMDFNTFAKYMMKYEQMKHAYNQSKVKSKPIQIPKKQEEKPTYHPPNYPLAHLAPHNRYRDFTGF
jgi:hypothetical protein